VKPVEILPAAFAESEEAAAWYAERDPDLGIAFALEVDKAIQKIADAPWRWPAHLHGTRRVLLKRFPYLIVYREEAKRVLVVAIAHGKRKPGYWKGR
jgi:plasmid stabilization system protein ParE